MKYEYYRKDILNKVKEVCDEFQYQIMLNNEDTREVFEFLCDQELDPYDTEIIKYLLENDGDFEDSWECRNAELDKIKFLIESEDYTANEAIEKWEDVSIYQDKEEFVELWLDIRDSNILTQLLYCIDEERFLNQFDLVDWKDEYYHIGY